MVSHRVKIWTQAMETPKPIFSMTTLCCLLPKKRVNPKENTSKRGDWGNLGYNMSD